MGQLLHKQSKGVRIKKVLFFVKLVERKCLYNVLGNTVKGVLFVGCYISFIMIIVYSVGYGFRLPQNKGRNPHFR